MTIKLSKDYLNTLIQWRRDFHQYPEPGWLEFRTTAKIAEQLEKWGYEIFVGREIIEEARLGVPTPNDIAYFYQLAKQEGVSSKWLAKMEGGYTGVIATLDSGNPGPTIAFRVDIDGLPINEANDEAHVPQKLGFRSKIDGYMHACGHDSHITIGLGLAEQLMLHKEKLKGKVKIIFQPAEEGVRGGSAIAPSSLLDDIQYLCALHIGTGVTKGTFVAGSDGFLATSKYDVTFTGVAAHSGAFPEQGKNALLASAQSVLAIHSLPTHSSGTSRINVGTLNAGLGRNIVPSIATMQVEVRGETTAINEFYEQQIINIFQGAAQMYDVKVSYAKVGHAISTPSDLKLAQLLAKTANQLGVPVIEYTNFKAGSEDATFLMKRVQENGGLAAYSIMGTRLAAGHHNEYFDIDEEDMLTAIEIWLNTVFEVYEEEN